MCQEDIDRCLRELALEVQSQPSGSWGKKKVLERLFRKLSEAIRRIPPRIETELDRYFYDETKQVVLYEMCQKIDEYNPIRGEVLAWYNHLFSRRLIDVKRKYFRRGLTRVPQDQAIPSLIDLDMMFPTDHFPSDDLPPSQQLRQLIEEDPNQMFSSLHVTGIPDANFRFLILAKIWEGRTWKDISKELEISVPTLSGFYQTHLKTFIPFFRNYLNQ
jgi:hypothetical protein